MTTLKNIIYSVEKSNCPICNSEAHLYGELDFSKNCEERRGTIIPYTGLMVGYNRCQNCGHIFAPCFFDWLPYDYTDHIYNDDYIIADPEYVSIRPNGMADGLQNSFDSVVPFINHLDYGGGDGLMSKLLQNKGWKSESYDPYGQSSQELPTKKYNFITAFEVLEHTAYPLETIETICSLLDEDGGILMLTTGLTDYEVDDNRKLSWWYIAPRNGHIGIFSSKSISLLAQKLGLTITSFEGKFILYKKLPTWLNIT